MPSLAFDFRVAPESRPIRKLCFDFLIDSLLVLNAKE